MTNKCDYKTDQCSKWASMAYWHFFDQLVTFLIIAPYKYSYLLTYFLTTAVQVCRNGSFVATKRIFGLKISHTYDCGPDPTAGS